MKIKNILLLILAVLLFGCANINNKLAEVATAELKINVSSSRNWSISKYTVVATKGEEQITDDFNVGAPISMTLSIGSWNISVTGKNSSNSSVYSGSSNVELTERGATITIILLQNSGAVNLTINNGSGYAISQDKPGYINKIAVTARKTGFDDIVKEVANFGDAALFTDLIGGEWDFTIEGKASKIDKNYSVISGEYDTYLRTTIPKNVAVGSINSYAISALNQVKVTPVLASAPSGAIINDYQLLLSCGTSGSAVKYAKNSDATADYTAPITLSGAAGDKIKLVVYAVKEGMADSTITELDYEINLTTTPTPAATPNGGSFQDSVAITLICSDTSADVYYTTDGSDPTISSAKYTAPITVTVSSTIKAIAQTQGKAPSPIISVPITITKSKVAAPIILPISGDYDVTTSFEITCSTAGAAIRYTTDGTTPGKTSTLYSAAFTLTEGIKTVKAIAYKDNYLDSDVKTETYNITSAPTGINIYVEKPDAWSEIWIWFDKDSDNVWETTALKTAPGDMVYYRTGWYKKEIASTSSVTFLFNDGTWVNKMQNGGADFVATSNVWVSKTGVMTTSDPIAPQKPTASATPGGCNFSSATIVVTLNLSGENISKSTYTLDGSDPSISGSAVNFSNGTAVTIGGDMEINDEKILKIYAINNVGPSTATYTFKKVEYQSQPCVMKLGAIYTPASTTFRIWSPDTANVKVKIDGNEYNCSKVADFDGYTDIYEKVLTGDHKNKEYQFLINGTAVRDPYGVMAKPGQNVNIVMDIANILPDGGWADIPPLTNREDSIVYEVHVRDFTIDSSSGVPENKRGKFTGMTHAGSTYSGVKTGIDHLVELGVTHVQVLPVYDFATQHYNWGYDPYNFNIPEEQYSETPLDYENRVKEFKNMVNEFHKRGLRVVMDVVYNHTFGNEMFQGITMKYFDGLNLSGCGNSVDSGKPMVSRFIQDSLEFWVSEYKIDGFRFDLVGIFYYNEYKKWGEYLNTAFPDRNIIIYGEPWNGYASDPNEAQKMRMGKCPATASGRVGVFNGKYREDIKGNNDGTTRGYMFNGTTSWTGAIAVGMRGSIMAVKSTNPLANDWDSMFAYDPEQSINYISAHDNYCLWDKIKHCGEDNAYGRRVLKFGNAMILTSQGIPFIHGGDEMLRTKVVNGVWTYAHNSYNAPDDYNKYRWDWKVTNAAIFNYHKELIALRKAHPGFRLTSWDDINSRMRTEMSSAPAGIGVVTNASLPYNVYVSLIDENNNVGDGYELIVVFNSGDNYTYTLPSGTWKKVFDINGAKNEVVTTSAICEGTAVTVFAKQ
ncbi:MAG TPA: chitobiase/beta-hexosaminidase C-terminal domain-containing protein [Spirochaetota bacterium]|jgi:pullulanase|nr:MAG: Pullulanase precursor [Spirochaetes bacterium ADurb.Bin133]HNZ26097.1 chitobiase/beta-hexosaminidase C-terminal domain-containing protein [Spirochaetota bacterium]HPY87913.1 chitobiase/beta-hexosaminidase C-terminal domain-containing protein [Spirochaetota bacterium]